MENQRKKDQDQARNDLDKAKLVQGKEIAEDKMDQNEDLAELRAETSIEKTILQKAMSDIGKEKVDVDIIKQ